MSDLVVNEVKASSISRTSVSINHIARIREESINIKMTDTDTLEFTISNDNQLCALFTLQFNSKYPFEAPKMTFIGPQYDFPTNLDLTLNFKKFSQSE